MASTAHLGAAATINQSWFRGRMWSFPAVSAVELNAIGRLAFKVFAREGPRGSDGSPLT